MFWRIGCCACHINCSGRAISHFADAINIKNVETTYLWLKGCACHLTVFMFPSSIHEFITKAKKAPGRKTMYNDNC